MDLIKKEYHFNELSPTDLKIINGGGVLYRFGKWLGEKWKDFSCGCGGELYMPDYSDLNGPKL